jgi:hypothetical protein
MNPTNDLLPGREVDGMLFYVDVQDVTHDAVESLVVHVEGDVVDARGVDGRDDRIVGYVAEQ